MDLWLAELEMESEARVQIPAVVIYVCFAQIVSSIPFSAIC